MKRLLVKPNHNCMPFPCAGTTALLWSEFFITVHWIALCEFILWRKGSILDTWPLTGHGSALDTRKTCNNQIREEERKGEREREREREMHNIHSSLELACSCHLAISYGLVWSKGGLPTICFKQHEVSRACQSCLTRSPPGPAVKVVLMLALDNQIRWFLCCGAGLTKLASHN